MADNSWPSPAHNAREVTDAEYEKIAMRFSDDGVDGSPADPAVVTAGAGLNVTVRADVYASVRGHAWYSGSTDITLPIAANTFAPPRYDRIVLRLDRSTWTVRVIVRQGGLGAGPPALVRDLGTTGFYEVLLAQVTVQRDATSVEVTRQEQYIGTRCRPCTSTTRPLNPIPGEHCYETDTGRLRVWTGSAWLIVHSTSGTINCDSDLEAWEIESQSVLEARSGVVCLRLGSWKRKAGTLSADTPSRLPVLIPAAYRHPNRDQQVIVYISGAEIGRAIVYSAASDKAGQAWITNKPAIATGQSVIPQSGISWVVD